MSFQCNAVQLSVLQCNAKYSQKAIVHMAMVYPAVLHSCTCCIPQCFKAVHVALCSTSQLYMLYTECLTAVHGVPCSSFSSRSDLIDVLMASAHVPWALDCKLTSSCRGATFMDGSLRYVALGMEEDLQPCRACHPLATRKLLRKCTVVREGCCRANTVLENRAPSAHSD
jgi:hypothetical protein